ncbi:MULTISPECIES: branched-chain amino acid ABC transporter permease [Thermomonosporaceae]|uniref:branched-chain amino acid ABC transporter permease n=1 Tax=Thermomonosporaceae TaxID=2012 RepID=UPI00255AB9A7|nr:MULTISPECIES: branched-chain amino acid ABC transporter permease [Thermomonosporaceae]MDL4777414.1 branched-chain amino acid ABC transporter permease [Actinomadura xylanilytica]
MSTVILLAVTGLALGALYFLIAAGISLAFGLMHVLNFAHGAFLTIGAYAGYLVASGGGDVGTGRFVLMLAAGTLAGALAAVVTELLLIRPLYGNTHAQLLVTVGLSLALVALIEELAGSDARGYHSPGWANATTEIAGSAIRGSRFLAIGVAVLVLAALVVFLRRTRYGLIIRAGVENRSMVTALGIDVRRAFTLVFALGGAAAGLGGVIAGSYFGQVEPRVGTGLFIYALIVIVIGGLGSLTGTAVAAVLVGLLQQFLNYYAAGVGDLSVLALLALVLLARPAGLFRSTAS